MPEAGDSCANLWPSRLFEKVFLEALLDHFLDAGVRGLVAVEHRRVGLLGFRLPEHMAVQVQDGRRKPGAGAVEDDPLLGHDLHDEIGILRLRDLFPGTGVDELARHILDLVFRDGMFGVIDDFEIDFVSGDNRLRKRVLGKGTRAQQGQRREKE